MIESMLVNKMKFLKYTEPEKFNIGNKTDFFIITMHSQHLEYSEITHFILSIKNQFSFCEVFLLVVWLGYPWSIQPKDSEGKT